MSRLAQLPVSLPSTPVPENTDAKDIAIRYSNIFTNLSEQSFVNDAAWRDSYALTGTLRTFYSARGVFAAWQECTSQARPHTHSCDASKAQVKRTPGDHAWVEVPFWFETASEPPLRCWATLWLVPDDKRAGDWKIWVMTTVLDRIKAAPSPDHLDPGEQEMAHSIAGQSNGMANGVHHSSEFDQPNGISHETETASKSDHHFDCVVLGGGQAGLNVAGRCKALELSYVVLEKNEQVGDNWANRYDSARLHTIRDYTQFPFDRTFGDEHEQFLHKDDLAEGYRSWASKFGINVWCSTALEGGTWDEGSKTWSLRVSSANGSQERHVTCSFVVMAVGAGGQIPLMPDLPGKDTFQGIVQHSEQYKSAKSWAGKHAVVVGTANTAHDIAEDMLAAGCASTTMVQRSETFVFPIEWYAPVQERTYNADFPVVLADKMGQSNPNAVQRLVMMANVHSAVRNNMGRFDALEDRGFRVDRFGDPTYHIFERLGGHYMDVGASQKIADGKIAVKSNSALTHYTPTGLGFADGSEIPADAVVFATGFDHNIRNRVAELFGQSVADQMGDFSYMDDEGEAAGAYKFLHPGLACHGGAIGPSRWFSRFLALYMKAAVDGTPLQVYSHTPVPPVRSELPATR